MKKYGYIAILICFSVLLSSCGKKDEPVKDLKYKDGVYSAKWGEEINGYTDEIDFEVKEDKITIISYDAKNKDGKSIKEDTDLKAKMIEYNKSVNLPETYPEKYQTDIIEAFGKTDGNPLTLDAIAGATQSTQRFKAMLDETLLINAMDGISSEYLMPLYANGRYKVKMPFYTEGWRDYAVISVKNGKFEVEEYDSEDIDGNLKSKDAKIKADMINHNKENNLAETYPEKYIPQIIQNFENSEGNIDTMNGVAGATKSVDSFKAMMSAVIESAKTRGPRTLTAKKYKDGTYSAKMDQPDNGWTDYLTITVKDDRVIITEYNSKNRDSKLKTEDDKFKADMIKANKAKNLPETYPTKYTEDMVNAFYESRFDVTKMDNIAGATVSTNNFKLMMGELLRYNAKNGITETLYVDPVISEDE